jgi:hypothetical protein
MDKSYLLFGTWVNVINTQKILTFLQVLSFQKDHKQNFVAQNFSGSGAACTTSGARNKDLIELLRRSHR